MVTEVGSAFVSIVPSLRGFSAAAQRELNRSPLARQAGVAGGRAGDSFSGGFTNRARVGFNRSGLFAGLATSARSFAPIMGVAAGAAVVFGLKTESAMEQAQVGFTTMLGSAKRAKDFLADLSQFAQTTPFNLPGVRTAAQRLLAFGFTAKEILPTLTAVGDASAGLGLGADGLDRITTAIGQIQAKGRVQSDELLQLTEAGVPALKILANQFHTTTADMQAMVTKGLVPAQKAIPALLSGLERGTDGLAGKTAKFGGLMEKQSHTLGGVFSNLVDTVTQGLGKALRPLARGLTEIIPKVTPVLQRVFRGVGDAFQAVGPALERVMPILTAIGGVLVRFVRGILPALTDAWHSITDAIGGSSGGLSRIGGMFSWLADHVLPILIKVVGFWIRNLGRGIGFAIRIVGFLASAFGTLKDFLTGPFLHGIGSAVSFIVRGFKFVLDVWWSVVGGILHGAAAAFGWVPGVGGKLKGAADAFDSFKAHADAVLSGIAEDAGRWGTATGQNFVHGFASIFSIFDSVGGLFKKGGALNIDDPGAASEVTNSIVPTFNANGAALGKAVGDGVSKGLKDSSTKVAKSVSDLADKILGPLKDLLGKARDLAHSIADGITGNLGLGSLATQTDSLGAEFTTSLRGIISGLAGQRALVRRFRHQLDQLGNRGLSEAAIQQVIAMGPVEGSAFAATLLTATRRQLRRITRLTRGINRGAAGIGRDVASDVYGPRIAAEVRRTTRAVEKAQKNTELGDKTLRRLGHIVGRSQRNSKVYLDTKALDRLEGQWVVTGG